MTMQGVLDEGTARYYARRLAENEGLDPDAFEAYLEERGIYSGATLDGLTDHLDDFKAGGPAIGAPEPNATRMPFQGKFPVTSRPGATDSALRTKPHTGTDFAMPEGTPVMVTKPGRPCMSSGG